MKYFSIRELTKSMNAVKRGIDNTPNAEQRQSLIDLVEHVLDPLRERWGAPIIVSSGFRNPTVNRLAGGGANSQHLKGEAADIHTVSDSRSDNMRLLRSLLSSDIEFDNVIAENVDSYGRPDWIHVSFTSKRKNRKLKTTMRKVNGKTKYTNGIKI